MSSFDKSPAVPECEESVVRALLYAAQLQVSDRELEWFVAEYRTLRPLADAMYIPELDSVPPPYSLPRLRRRRRSSRLLVTWMVR